MSKFPDELTCDMAETYGIFDIKRVPVQLLAPLAVGLRDDSRVKRAASNTTCSDEIILLASIADSLRWIVWSKTEDGANNRNRPASIMDYYTKSRKQEDESDFESFGSPDEFWQWARSVTENN